MGEGFERHQRVRALYEQMRSLPPDTQTAALAAACADDPVLHREVAQLLSASAQVGSFLERGAAAAITAGGKLIGRRVGPYEIQEVIGAGGMGDVYRAHDTSLGRDVALKVLPDVFASDPDRLTRFQREAQMLAALNHPHIGAIYGLEASDGVRALVLELVEGPTLADRIASGPIPLDEALTVARQILAALEAAHERGIIHRDLKPANIKLRADGTVKVLDFGLAKAHAPQSARTGSTLTQPGVLLGTVPYMSPEQAQGRAADQRSDMWAFGCVLFEMLSGRAAFDGDDVAATLVAILTKEPDWALLPQSTPRSIRRLLRRCLEKDHRQRLAHAADARLELDDVDEDRDLHESTASGVTASGADAKRRGRRERWVPWSLAAVSVIAAGFAAILVFNRPRDVASVSRTSILLPGVLGAAGDNRGTTAVALAPDGRSLALTATDAAGRTRLWLRTLDSSTPRPIEGTDGARSPFWSPDSRWIAFIADDTLKKVDVSGGSVVTLCGSAWAGGAWNRDDVILFTHTSRLLARVAATGGQSTPVTTVDAAANEFGHLSPSFLPDGRRFVYAAVLGSFVPQGVYIGSTDGDERTPLPVDAPVVQYSQGYLWFVRGTTLTAQRFDAREGRLAGNAMPVAERLRAFRNATFFSVSDAGTLVFQGNPSPGYVLTWFDRQGRPTGTLGTRDDYGDVGLSPDGRRALVSIGEVDSTNRDLWIFDIARGVRTRLTSDPTTETHNVWSPDGSRIAFDSRSPGHFGLFQKRSDGTGAVETLLAGTEDVNPVAWSPDGRFILYIRRKDGTANIWALPLDGARGPFALTHGRFNVPGQFSPDGRWVVYASDDSGRMEIYIIPFPGPGPKVLVSTGGGWDPRWRQDGKEIVYMDQARTTLMSAALKTEDGRFEVTEVKPLFRLAKVSPRSSYDISPDGQRILALVEPEEAASAPLTLVTNWPALLAK